jgi:HEAT repeat protein
MPRRPRDVPILNVKPRLAELVASLADMDKKDLLETGRPSPATVLLLLHDRSAIVRVCAAEAALDLGFDELSDTLAAMAVQDPSRLVRGWAGYALAGLRKARAIPILRWCQARERTSWGQAFFAGALLSAGDDAALETVLAFLDSTSVTTRRVVGATLARDCPPHLRRRAEVALEATLPTQEPWYVRRDLEANLKALRALIAAEPKARRPAVAAGASRGGSRGTKPAE